MTKQTESTLYVVAIVAIVVIFIMCLVVPPYFEAATYRRLTGKNVTWWDAVWVELRVQEGAKGE